MAESLNDPSGSAKPAGPDSAREGSLSGINSMMSSNTSTSSLLSGGSHELQQYSEAELHGEYEAQYFGFTADVVTDSCKFAWVLKCSADN